MMLAGRKVFQALLRFEWEPWVPVKLVRQFAGVSSAYIPEIVHMKSDKEIKTHDDLYQFSVSHPNEFWGALATSRLKWIKPFEQVMDCDMANGNINWFKGGQLNVSVNCVDRHYQQNPDKIALIWEKDEPGMEEKVSYKQLYEMMNQIGNLLRHHGVKKGDRVAIYMPVSPLAVAAMLGTIRIGAIHTVIFAGFSPDAISNRINDANCETIITCDQGLRGGKVVELKKTVDAAMKTCPSVRQVFVGRRTGADVPMGSFDIDLDKAMKSQPKECEPEIMNSEDPLFMLYTSGSTGKPKGIVHCQAGYLLYTAVTHKHVFNYNEGDIFGCVADIGWITGHSYVVYGPLCNGGTSLLFESTPVYPDPGRYWKTVERFKLTHFYGAPTAIRLLIQHGDQWVKKYNRSSLRILGSVGEPINYDAWKWYHDVVGEAKCQVVDTWWQTETGGVCIVPPPPPPPPNEDIISVAETGGVCIAPRPSAINAAIIPASPMRPMFGIDPVLLDEKGKILKGNEVSGALCIRQPWPGLAKTLYGDHKRFVDTYFKSFSGYYFSGDGALRDKDGYYHITGRMDDVINVTGHRLGTAEIEDILDHHHDVAETAVVGYPHDLKGEGIYAYVVLKISSKLDHKTIRTELNSLVKEKIAGYAVPEMIQICPGLPKTRSGKIMRRILRKIAQNKTEDLGDTSTLADPSVIDQIVSGHKELKKK